MREHRITNNNTNAISANLLANIGYKIKTGGGSHILLNPDTLAKLLGTTIKNLNRRIRILPIGRSPSNNYYLNNNSKRIKNPFTRLNFRRKNIEKVRITGNRRAQNNNNSSAANALRAAQASMNNRRRAQAAATAANFNAAVSRIRNNAAQTGYAGPATMSTNANIRAASREALARFNLNNIERAIANQRTNNWYNAFRNEARAELRRRIAQRSRNAREAIRAARRAPARNLSGPRTLNF
jgi:hypothetical protein